MTPLTIKPRSFHYGWVIASTGILVIFSCFGLARYAYTMILPGMQSGLGLAYERMGFIGTCNFAGYLTAVLAIVFLVQSVAYLLAGLHIGTAGLVVSIILYGLAVFAIPAIMTAAIGDYLGLSRAASALATVTIFFALGQTIGPGAAGLFAGASSSFAPSYLFSSLLTACAALFAAMLPAPAADRA